MLLDALESNCASLCWRILLCRITWNAQADTTKTMFFHAVQQTLMADNQVALKVNKVGRSERKRETRSGASASRRWRRRSSSRWRTSERARRRWSPRKAIGRRAPCATPICTHQHSVNSWANLAQSRLYRYRCLKENTSINLQNTLRSTKSYTWIIKICQQVAQILAYVGEASEFCKCCWIL